MGNGFYNDPFLDRQRKTLLLLINNDTIIEELLRWPRNLPRNWQREFIEEDKGFLYTNPENPDEFLLVMPGIKNYHEKEFHEPYAIYHLPSDLVSKQFKPEVLFDRENEEHMNILKNLNKEYPLHLPDGKIIAKKAERAGQFLEKYHFNFTDLVFARKFLGFKDLPPSITEHIHNTICSCHYLTLSDTQGGMMYRHKEHHYYGTRVAHHLKNPNERPFLKISRSGGYHTATGKLLTADSNDAHIPFEQVIGNPLHWNITPCKKNYPLRKFDYLVAKKYIENRIEKEKEQRKHLYNLTI